MPLPALGAKPFGQGLSNQKLAIAGLVAECAKSARSFASPKLVDFLYGRGSQPILGFDQVFSLESFSKTIAKLGVSTAPEFSDVEYLEPDDLFKNATAALSRAKRDGALTREFLVCSVLGSLQPTPKVGAIVHEMGKTLRNMDVTVGLQLRIEKDWLSYVAKHLSRRPNVERQLIAHTDILHKVRQTFGSSIKRIYVNCNESDLPLKKGDISRDASERFGYELVWKSDFIGPCDELSYLERAMVDFETTQLFEKYIGLTRSTFFNVAATTHFSRNAEPTCRFFAYNVSGSILAERSDHGVFPNPREATAS